MRSNYLLLGIAYIILILAVLILPFYTDPAYNILKNGLSELGAQNTRNNWVMNVVLILLGVVTFMNGYIVLKGFQLQKLVLLGFSLSLCLTAVYLHAPINHSLPYDSTQNEIHSIFSTITGVLFFAYSLTISFIARWRNQKVLAIVVGVIVIALSYFMIIYSEYRGVYQRVIFIVAFGWIVYSFKFYEYSMTRKEYFRIIKKTKNER